MGSSVTVKPNSSEDITVSFAPVSIEGSEDREARIKIAVMNNAFDSYTVKLQGKTYSCDAVLDTSSSAADKNTEDYGGEDSSLEKPQGSHKSTNSILTQY